MNPQVLRLVFATVTILGFAALAAAMFPDSPSAQGAGLVEIQAQAQGKETFRFDTFDDEQLWKSVDPTTANSTFDDSVMTGIGKRLDGRPNRSLDVGKIISLSPVLTAEQK
jgi:hypothetical protein